MNTDPSSNISRWVTFLLGPLILIASGFVAIKAKSWFNYDLAPAEAAAYFTTIIGGIAAGVVTWVRNRGKYEIAKATGIDDATLDLIASAIASRLPQAPSAPSSGAVGQASGTHPLTPPR
jgi:hypothetical protein